MKRRGGNRDGGTTAEGGKEVSDPVLGAPWMVENFRLRSLRRVIYPNGRTASIRSDV